MGKQKNHVVQCKKSKQSKNKTVIKGGYVSSLAGISQTDRALAYEASRSGSGVHENKKRKSTLKPKHKKCRDYSDSCAYFFAQKYLDCCMVVM